MILRDKYALHRHPASGEPLPGEPEWTEWDYALADALQLIEDFSDENGLLVWERDSEDVLVEAVKHTNPYDSAVERTTSRNSYKKTPGEYFRPRLSLQPWAKGWPTFRGWAESHPE